MQAAGGITFLALAPLANGAFKPIFKEGDPLQIRLDKANQMPRFLFLQLLPYLQPGAASRLVDGSETMVIAWQTNGVKADYELTYGESGSGKTAEITHASRLVGRQSRR